MTSNMPTTRDPRIVHEDEVDWVRRENGDRFAYARRALSKAAGGEGLGCSLYELPPGKRDFPYHLHHGNDEAIFVLEGAGTLRLDGAEHAITAGDYVSIPRGPGGAHQIHNTSGASLRFLVMSTMRVPDMSEYPDSQKVGVFAGAAPGGDDAARTHQGFYPTRSQVGYFEGE